jgi:hypothetical protein
LLLNLRLGMTSRARNGALDQGNEATIECVNRRKQLLRRLDDAWRAFHESYGDLPEEKRLEPGVIGDWSVKDIIAHVSVWEEETLKHLPVILTGQKPPRYSVTHGGIDAFNAETMKQRKNLPLAEVLRQSEAIHQRVIALIESAPEAQLDSKTRFRQRLRLDTYGHYKRHTNAIRKWRNQGDISESGALQP